MWALGVILYVVFVIKYLCIVVPQKEDVAKRVLKEKKEPNEKNLEAKRTFT